MEYNKTRFYDRADQGLESPGDAAIMARARSAASGAPRRVVRSPLGDRGEYGLPNGSVQSASESRGKVRSIIGVGNSKTTTKSSPLHFSGRSPEPLGKIVIPERAERVVQLQSGEEGYFRGAGPEFCTYVVSRRRAPGRAGSGKLGKLGKSGELAESAESKSSKRAGMAGKAGKRASSAKSAKGSKNDADDAHRARI